MTQEQLAKAADVAQTTIGNIEAGLRKQPRNLLAIAKALNVNPEWLQTGKGPKEAGAQEPSNDPKWVGHKWSGSKALSPAQEKLWKAVLLWLEYLPDEPCRAIETLISYAGNEMDKPVKTRRKVTA